MRGGAPETTTKWYRNDYQPFTGLCNADMYRGFRITISQTLEVEAYLQEKLLDDGGFQSNFKFYSTWMDVTRPIMRSAQKRYPFLVLSDDFGWWALDSLKR